MSFLVVHPWWFFQSRTHRYLPNKCNNYYKSSFGKIIDIQFEFRTVYFNNYELKYKFIILSDTFLYFIL